MILDRIAALGELGDTIVRHNRKEDLVRNMLFSIRQQQLRGSLIRFKRQHEMSMSLSWPIRNAIAKGAFMMGEKA